MPVPGGEVLRIGPFTGGLNLGSDITTVADTELVELVNLELDIDGSLKSRPPIQLHYTESANEFGTDRLLIIGSAVFSGTSYLFGSNVSGTFRSTNGTTWTLLQTTTECKTAVQYRGKVWFPATPGSTSGGFNWDPVGGVTAVAAIPRGSAAVIHKERMYLVPGPTATTNASRLRFSDAADLTTWGASNFIDVSPDDGTTLNDVIVYADNLMLFKNDSIFVLAYDLQPAEAILREINSVIGVRLPHCVTQFENVVYIIHRDKVYEIVNYDFNILNAKVPFVYDATVDPGGARTEEESVSLFGERLVVRYYNKTYVFGIRTRTWSEWKKTVAGFPTWHNLGPLVRLPSALQTTSQDEYYASYTFNTVVGKLYKIVDGLTASGDEGDVSTDTITCTITTKDFDMADPVHFKKLFWWGADVVTGNAITGTVSA
ncbi:MAG: hypothetical protein ACREOB_04685, partial [Thermodesulfobacteriota bacterium]